MTANDREEFSTMIAAMATMFGREVDDALFEGYHLGLEDLPIQKIRTAVTRAIRESKFMPTVAELRGLAGEVSPSGKAQLAWDVVERAIASVGFYGSVDFDDKCVNATIHHLGGWEHVCNAGADMGDGKSAAEKLGWMRREFEKAYVKFYESGIHPSSTLPCRGYLDRTNMENGNEKHTKAPKLISTGFATPKHLIRHDAKPAKRIERRGEGGPRLIGESLS